ncbi:hypothetical protein B9Z19DRAFT_1119920 [Tuber borchii]|uniref:Uncharacterized protein n=1 Tax=Tuber borchii TaxID=42251 RepID=A0A2T7A5E8_TUBBO|nr:hypothetical protein B9Z19DRAFT_1119920 [Tuber borchii]
MAPKVDIDLNPGECRPLLDEPDLYGLGVRIGTYTQWLSTIIATCLMQDQKERVNMQNVNYIFAFAGWVALVNQTRSTWPADAVIVILLFMGTLTLHTMIEVFDRMRPRTVRRKDPNLGTAGEVVRTMLLSAFLIWVTWWWFEGIYHTSRDCGAYIFYYGGPVRVLGNFKLIGRIWSLLLLLMIIPVLEKFWFMIKRTRAHSRAQRGRPVDKHGPPINVWSWEFWTQVAAATQEETAELEKFHPPDIPNPQTKQRRGLYCALLLGIGVFILIIFLEIMLVYGNSDEINKISGVGDTVSMVTGCSNVLMILWKLKQQRVTEREKRRRLLGEYRYPKTFLYDAEFPLLQKIKHWLRITGSEHIPDGPPPPGQPQHEPGQPPHEPGQPPHEPGQPPHQPGQPQIQGQDIQEIHPHAQ